MSTFSIERLRGDVAEILGEQPNVIDDEDNLVDWGLDSIRLMTLVQRWKDAGASVTFAALAERPQLSHWHSLITGG